MTLCAFLSCSVTSSTRCQKEAIAGFPGSSNKMQGVAPRVLSASARNIEPRTLQVVSPRVRAFLYTWGGGRTTAEGEHIPFRMDPIELQHADHISLVLPLTLEHEIDERSPLYGHTYDSLTVGGIAPPHARSGPALEPAQDRLPSAWLRCL